MSRLKTVKLVTAQRLEYRIFYPVAPECGIVIGVGNQFEPGFNIPLVQRLYVALGELG